MPSSDSIVQCQLKLILRPSQERQLVRWLWRLTGVYNWAIRKIELDANNRIYHSTYDLEGLLVGHHRKLDVPLRVAESTVRQAHQAWQRCFRKLARKPRLKGNRNRLNSILIRQPLRSSTGNRIKVPTFGVVKFHQQDIPEGPIKNARLVRRASGWYLCLTINAAPAAIEPTGHAEIGIDPGFQSLLTLSTSEKVEHPHELARTARRLAQAQRGRNRRLTARLLERQRNQRKDRNHKLSRRLVAENVLIAWSADRTRAIARTFGKSVASAAHGATSIHAGEQMPCRRPSVCGGALSEFHEDLFGMWGSHGSDWLGRTLSKAMGVCRLWNRARSRRERCDQHPHCRARNAPRTSRQRFARNCRVSKTAKFNTDAGTPKESAMIAPRTDAELVEFLQAQLDTLTAERDALRDFLEGRGYRRCDIPACNCNLWHGGHAEDRLREISDSLSDAGVPGGTTIHGGVLTIIERAEAAEAQLAALTAERDKWKIEVERLSIGLLEQFEETYDGGAGEMALERTVDATFALCDTLKTQVDALTAEGVRLREQLEEKNEEKT